MNRKRICIVTEINERRPMPPDDGVRKFSYYMVKELTKISETVEIRNQKTNLQDKLLLSTLFKKKIRKFNPEIIYYIPTFLRDLTFLKAKILKTYKVRSKIVLIALQPFGRCLLSRGITRLLTPDLIFVQSQKEKGLLSKWGCNVEITSSGVDLERFVPSTKLMKQELRQKYRFSNDRFIVLHVGHINLARNIRFLKKIKRVPNLEVILVGSSDSSQNLGLLSELERYGIRVINRYIWNIEEIYQLSDCYVFPVENKGASIGVPLSVLEAMACNLPIITTKFGGLPIFFSGNDGFLYVNKSEEIIDKIYEVRELNKIETRKMVTRFSWSNITRKMLSKTLKKIK